MPIMHRIIKELPNAEPLQQNMEVQMNLAYTAFDRNQ